MTDTDYTWVKSQLHKVKARQNQGDAILALLPLWESFVSLSPDQKVETLEFFTKLAQGHALVPGSDKEIWIQSSRGDLKIGDTVRVRHDAFPDDAGRIHNGRVGKIVGIRSGDIIVKTTDGIEPSLDGVHYPPNALELRLN